MFTLLICANFLVVVLGQNLDTATAEQEYFVQKIFDLYGDKNHLSFEGFEHLMESLGLGGVHFDKSHNLSMHKDPGGKFIEVHDELRLHSHNHSDDHEVTETAGSRKVRSLPVRGLGEACITAEQLLMLYGLEPSHRVAISHERFMQICPAIVYQLDRKACSPNVLISGPISEISKNLSTAHTTTVWIGATISIIVISISGLVGVCIVPLLKKDIFQNILFILVASGFGTLCGDALLHLLPHAFGQDGNQSMIFRTSATLIVIMIYFIVEAIIYGKVSDKKRSQEKKKLNQDEESSYQLVPKGKDCHRHSHGGLKKAGDGSVATIAWMVMTGDGLHNLTDGLAVGAAFKADLVSGLATSIAVLTHELPHELGDFAVLLQSGVPAKSAIYYNMLSSLLSLVGMAMGIVIGEIESAANWIYCITAGSFLYIALSDLIPEMHRQRADGRWVAILFLQVSGMFIGFSIMFLIAMYEHLLEDLMSGQLTN